MKQEEVRMIRAELEETLACAHEKALEANVFLLRAQRLAKKLQVTGVLRLTLTPGNISVTESINFYQARLESLIKKGGGISELGREIEQGKFDQKDPSFFCVIVFP